MGILDRFRRNKPHKHKEDVRGTEPTVHTKGKHNHGVKGKGRTEDHVDEMLEKGSQFLGGGGV
jgi:hypothetical protein